MNKKFENIQVEAGTIILFERMHQIGEFEVLYQIWQQGIYMADSIIFSNEDVDGLTEEEIIDMVKNDAVFKAGLGSSVTFVRTKSGYTFVNFNFQENEPDFSVGWDEIEKDRQRVEKWKKEIRERDEANRDNQIRQKPIN